MYIIDQTYFIKELSIPNLNEMDSDTLSSLDVMVDDYVRLLLQNLLGYELFNDLDSNIENGVLKEDAAQKWVDLVNGVEYTKDSKTHFWNGLIYKRGLHNHSLLAKYVFYYWLKDSVSLLTGTGEKSITASNMIAVNSNQRMLNVWNSFVEDYQYNYCKTLAPSEYYHNGVLIIDWLGNNQKENQYVSLVKFISDHESDYPNAPKMLYNEQNQLGL